MKTAFFFLIIGLLGCSQQKTESIFLECNGTYSISSSTNGVSDSSTNSIHENAELKFEVINKLLNERNFKNYVDIKCQTITNDKIVCDRNENNGDLTTIISLDRFGGNIKIIHTDKFSAVKYVRQDVYNGICRKIEKSF